MTVIDIPLFPLSNVLFPAGCLSLRIFEPRYLAMMQACIRDDSVFGAVLIRAGYEVGRPAIPCEVGCTARIIRHQAMTAVQHAVVAQGETLFRIRERRVETDGLIRATVELVDPCDPTPLPERHAPLAALLTQLHARLPADQRLGPARFEDAAWVANRLAEWLPINPERKQALLEMRDPLQALDRIGVLMADLNG